MLISVSSRTRRQSYIRTPIVMFRIALIACVLGAAALVTGAPSPHRTVTLGQASGSTVPLNQHGRDRPLDSISNQRPLDSISHHQRPLDSVSNQRPLDQVNHGHHHHHRRAVAGSSARYAVPPPPPQSWAVPPPPPQMGPVVVPPPPYLGPAVAPPPPQFAPVAPPPKPPQHLVTLDMAREQASRGHSRRARSPGLVALEDVLGPQPYAPGPPAYIQPAVHQRPQYYPYYNYNSYPCHRY